jgi:tRNA pseudouridine55 synthase
VVAKIRGTINAKSKIPNTKKIKVGHTGTLDPFATGLLIILVGDATKKQDQFMKLDKEYEATLKLGLTSSTGDPEGDIMSGDTTIKPKIEMIQKTLSLFTGEISQTPPPYSAIKINGTRAYKLARGGKKVKLKSRRVKIYKIEVQSYKFPELNILVKCSSGTYIRTLAEDIGKALKTGAYLSALRRTKVGGHDIKSAASIEDIISTIEATA